MSKPIPSSFVAVKTKFVLNGQVTYQWVVKPVTDVIGTNKPIRCMVCEGPVRIHTQRSIYGPQPHVEHMRREDSEECPNGVHFKGERRKPPC